MIYFPENIQNFNLISTFHFRWNDTNLYQPARPYHALSYRKKGDVIFNTGDVAISAGTGDLTLVPRNLSYHRISHTEELFCVHFTCDGLCEDTIQHMSPLSSTVIEELFCRQHQIWSKKKPGYSFATSSLFFKIIANIQSMQADMDAVNSQLNMHEIMNYIHEHFTENTLSIKDLAKISAVSESLFRKQFKQLHGISPLQYINNLRVKYACELIKSNYYKIYEVAEKAGYTNVKHFSASIKKATGLTPREISKHT